MKRGDFFFLQHKLPWESDWEDIEKDKTCDSSKFIDHLREEPAHVIEMEYRVVRKEKVKLKTSNKTVFNPVYVLSGPDLATIVEQRIKRV